MDSLSNLNSEKRQTMRQKTKINEIDVKTFI